MANENKQYSGLSGFFRKKKIKNKVKKLVGTLQLEQIDNEDRRFFDTTMVWNGASRLIYLASIKTLRDKYMGLYDLGFIKMCKNWVEKFNIVEMDDNLSNEMCATVLPKDVYSAVQESLATKKRGK